MNQSTGRKAVRPSALQVQDPGRSIGYDLPSPHLAPPTGSDSKLPATSDERLRNVARLQQKVAALEAELAGRKASEEALRRREAELTALVESAAVGMHWVGADGIIRWANQAEFDLLGHSREEYVGHHIAEFHADQVTIDDILARLCRGERLRNHEARLRCKDGTIKIVMIDSSVFWEGDRFVHTQCFTRDITAQRISERNSALLAAIVTSSDDAIVSKNLNGIVTSWNQSAERIFGFSAEDMIGQPILKIIPIERQNEEPHIIARIQRGERVDHFETVRRRKDGRPVEVSLTISPIKDSHGRIVGASKVARDITEKKLAERAVQTLRDQLAHANAELEQRVQERTTSLREAVAQMEEFSYTVSHDLRAPLRGMLVYSQALLEDYGATLDPEARHCLTRIAESATRLDKMVQEVLTFSRISRMDLKMEQVSLDSIVREIVRHYPQMQAPRALIDIGPLAEVLGHEPSLIQALSNLLLNGVKFVAPGVTPKLRVWTEPREPAQIRLWIEDNGIGVKPELQGRLFRMFERVHPHLAYDGTGVGLAIVRKAVTRMGGDAGVESDGVNGSRFWIQLPTAPPAP